MSFSKLSNMDADFQKGGGPMATQNTHSMDQQITTLAEKLWLAYFNSYLYEKEMITENERNRMLLKIESRNGSTCRAKEKELP